MTKEWTTSLRNLAHLNLKFALMSKIMTLNFQRNQSVKVMKLRDETDKNEQLQRFPLFEGKVKLPLMLENKMPLIQLNKP